MNEETDPTTPATNPEPEKSDGFEPITTQDQLEKVIGQRIARERSKYADYKDLRAKAAKFDELQKTADDRIAAIEQELTTERRERRREKVAAAKGVPASALHGDTDDELNACADDLLSWRGVKPEKPKTPPTGLKSGATNSDSRMDPQERAVSALRAFRKG